MGSNMRNGLTYSEAGKLGGLKYKKTANKLKLARIEEYNKNPKLCLQCHTPIKYNKKSVNKFCSKSCSATFNNVGSIKLCLNCGVQLHTGKLYCSKKCHREWSYIQYIADWKNGTRTGLEIGGTVTTTIKRYLREKYNNACCLCGWNKINPHTNKVPLVADHIDGNWKNNTEENLRLICWNCDSIGSTFGGLNKGNGRKLRKR